MPTSFDQLTTWLRAELTPALQRWEVPAAAVAVQHGDDQFVFAAGNANLATGVEADADTVFQIGSVTKVWTATMVMQLVEQGRVDLDAPVQRYLPDFALSDRHAAAAITVRHLLVHTAGFEGDVFTDFGRGDDALARYVEHLADTPQLFPPGEMFSYNNAGYCVLGRLVEVVHGAPFDRCLHQQLIAPLGLTHTAVNADEAILYRAATGHVRPAPGQVQERAPVWAMAHSNAPAGSQLTMRAVDLLAFARMHLAGGTAADGAVVLGRPHVAAMQRAEVTVPDLGVMGDSWGLGWEVYDADGTALVGHDGNTIGQASYLRLCPIADLAVVLLTNGGDAAPLAHHLLGRVLADLADVRLPTLPVPPDEPGPVDAGYVVGTYSAAVADLVVTADADGRVWVEQRPQGELAELAGGPPERIELVGYRGGNLIPREPHGGLHIPHVFLGDDGTGRAQFLHVGRAVRRA